VSAVTVWQGLEERLRTVDGLQNVLLGEPSSVHDWPAIYGAYERFTHPLKNSPPARGIVGFDHVFVLRLCIQWVDNPQAEMQLLSLLTAIPLAIDADPKLAGRIGGGMAHIDEGAAGFAEIGGVKCRVVDYTCQVLEKVEGI
jgi:hypothetical protein